MNKKKFTFTNPDSGNVYITEILPFLENMLGRTQLPCGSELRASSSEDTAEDVEDQTLTPAPPSSFFTPGCPTPSSAPRTTH